VIVRLLTKAALLVLPLSCSGETPRRTSAPSDSGHADAKTVQVIDTAATQGRPDAEPGPQLLTPDGWGPLRIGMNRAEVVAAVGDDGEPDAVGGSDPEACDEFHPRNAPDGVLVMIQDGVLTRVSVSRNSAISTPTGFRVGDSGSAVLAEYGTRARVEPHQYWAPPAKYVTAWRQARSQSERRGIRYEISSEDEIVHLRGGGPSIEYVEGCV